MFWNKFVFNRGKLSRNTNRLERLAIYSESTGCSLRRPRVSYISGRTDCNSISQYFTVMANLIFTQLICAFISSTDPSPLINWMKNNKLLATSMECDFCKESMMWSTYSQGVDQYRWKCNNRSCEKFTTTKSIRQNSFFEKSHLPLKTWIFSIYLWTEHTCLANAKNQLGISHLTASRIYARFRGICKAYFQRHPISLGGMGAICEVDESCFSSKPKHHRGRSTDKQMWVFGLVDTSVHPGVGYMQIVERRDAATLLPIIGEVVKPGSIIHSDEWRAYKKIPENLGFEHKTVNHSIWFVDKKTNVHTQTIEAYWSKQKRHLRAMKGCKRHVLEDYLQELMFRERHIGNLFYDFCDTIAEMYPV